jgi:NlpC/P60 family putative phage cell wall peptidase
MVTRESIVKAARGWLGTPYHHQASVKGIGTDCLGLIRGLWRELYGPEPETMPAYTRDWGDATGSETLLAAACRHLVKLDDVSAAREGDVLVFRMRDAGVAKHAGILVSAHGSRPGRHPEVRAQRASKDGRAPHHDAQKELRLIHAQEGIGVIEIALGRWWRRRAAAAFQFPGVV